MKNRIATLAIALTLSFSSLPCPTWSEDGAPADVFEQRIMPIFRSPNPSSCVQCHLASVDLKEYILPSSTETFLSLRKQGLIDTDSPADSKILRLIKMGADDRDAMARRIHKKNREAELNAFTAWIEACCKDEALLEQEPEAVQAIGPSVPDEVIRHTRKSRLVTSFTRNVWSQRMRCFPCHTPHEIDPKNPMHRKPAERHREFVAKYGAKMNLFAKTPESTMRSLIASSRKKSDEHFPMLNFEEPSMSLLVLKPTSKLPPKNEDGTFAKPSATLPVSHMGGLKMHLNDQSYKAIVGWIADYSASKQGQFKTVSDLPQQHWVPTQKVLRMKGCPDDWKAGTVVQLFAHRWNDQTQAFDTDPVAFTQGTVTPRHLVNGTMSMIVDHEADSRTHPKRLPPGKYQIHVHVDHDGVINEQPTALLGEDSHVGQVELNAKWKVGFKAAEMIEFKAIP